MIKERIPVSGKPKRESLQPVVTASLSWLLNPESVIRAAHKKHGLSFYLRLPILGKTLVTGDPLHIRQIRGNPKLVGGKGMTVLRPLLGDDTLIMMDSQHHKDRRYALSQLFTPDRLKAFDSLMRNKLGETAISYSNQDKVTAYSFFQEILLAVIVAFLFPDSPPAAQKKLEKLVSTFFQSVHPPLMLFIKPLQVDLGSFSQWGRMKKAKRELQVYIRNMLETDAGLLKNSDLSMQQVVDEMIALLLFGHDTSAAALAWAVHHCLDNPQHIPHLIKDASYLEAVILESMRLNPVVVHLTRLASEDLLIGHHPIKANMRILPCAYLAHFNPEVFSSPYQFQPERFLQNASFEDSYFPFGFGNRVCIGKQFALQQMRVLLPELFKRVRVEKLDPVVVPVRDNVIMVPKGAVKMSLLS